MGIREAGEAGSVRGRRNRGDGGCSVEPTIELGVQKGLLGATGRKLTPKGTEHCLIRDHPDSCDQFFPQDPK